MELQDASLCRHFPGMEPDPVDEDWLWAKVVRDVCLRNIDWAAGINLESSMNETGLGHVKSTEYQFALCYPVPNRPETQLISAYTAKYVPNVIFGLLDQYAREQYSADDIEKMKIAAQEDAYSGKIEGLHWKFHVCIGKKDE